MYCVSCKKHTVNENSNVRKAKQNRLMFLSNCTACARKNQLLYEIENSIILINLK